LTPWDYRVFKHNTLEILDIKYEFRNDLEKILILFENEIKSLDVKFVYTRISVSDKDLRIELQKNGFYLAEISHNLGFSNLESYQKKIKEIELFPISILSHSEIEVIKEIAKNSFDFSRFHDDVNISEMISRTRYYNWIDDLLKMEIEGFYIKIKDEIIGFHFQKVNKEHANLILTGCKKGKSEAAIFLWHSVLMNLKKRNVKSCDTTISASNVGIINLYNFFGFRTNNAVLGMHKFY